MTAHPAVARWSEHVNPDFVRLLGTLGFGRVFVRAKGTRLWDSEGREVLDFLAGFGATSLGHNHPRLTARLRALLDEDPVGFPHVGPQPQAAELAEALAKRAPAPLSVSLFGSGGAEAIDAAMKLAAAATGRSCFVHCQGGYHGTSLGPLALMGHPRMRAPFEALLPASTEIPFGDLGALEGALAKKKVAAFVVEPIQGEGGVVLPPPGYLAGAKRLCAEHGTLLVLDEIQTGLGRTGTFLALEAEGVVPDVLVLAKALSGGIAPISVAMVSKELQARAYGGTERFDLQASTFAGNAWSCAAALETLRIIDDEKLCDASREKGGRLLSRLRQRLAGHPLVKDIRGRGLLAAVELGATGAGLLSKLAPGLVDSLSEKVIGQWVAVRLLERGVLVQPASHRWNVVRLEPPLTVDDAEIDTAVEELGLVLDEVRSAPAAAIAAGKRVLEQRGRGWSFR
jgi:putrescine aminotransferase